VCVDVDGCQEGPCPKRPAHEVGADEHHSKDNQLGGGTIAPELPVSLEELMRTPQFRSQLMLAVNALTADDVVRLFSLVFISSLEHFPTDFYPNTYPYHPPPPPPPTRIILVHMFLECAPVGCEW
jgi:hypothetical protein